MQFNTSAMGIPPRSNASNSSLNSDLRKIAASKTFEMPDSPTKIHRKNNLVI